MPTTGYIDLPAQASPRWKSPVANSAALPLTGNTAGDVRVTLNTDFIYVWSGSAWILAAGGASLGDVVGPASSTNNALALFNGTTGKLLKNSTLTYDGSSLSKTTDNAYTIGTSTAGRPSIVYAASGFQCGNIGTNANSIPVAFAGVPGFYVGSNLGISGFDQEAYGTGVASFGPFLVLRSARGTNTAPSATLVNDFLGSLTMSGFTGTDWNTEGFALVCKAAENYSSTNKGTLVSFRNIAVGSAISTSRLQLTGAGAVAITSGATSFTIGTLTTQTVTLANAQTALTVTATPPSSGNTIKSIEGFMAVGYTGNQSIRAGNFVNQSNSTGYDLGSVYGNIGVRGSAQGDQANTVNISVIGESLSGLLNIGVSGHVLVGQAGLSTNVGVQGFARNDGTINVGFYGKVSNTLGHLTSTTPNASAVAYFNNDDSGVTVLDCLVNSVTKVKVNGTGNLVLSNNLQMAGDGVADIGDFLDNRPANINAQLGLFLGTAEGSGAIGFLFSHGTNTSPTAVLSGDLLSEVDSRGYDGSSYPVDTSIQTYATENHTPTAHGSRLVIQTTPNTTDTPLDSLSVEENGDARIRGALGVGNSAAATTLGSVVKKIEIFDSAGASLGFIPVYNTIT